MARLNISVEMREGDDLLVLTRQIEKAAAFHCDGSGAGFGYRDTEYDVPTVDAGERAGARVEEAFKDRHVTWEVLVNDEVRAWSAPTAPPD